MNKRTKTILTVIGIVAVAGIAYKVLKDKGFIGKGNGSSSDPASSGPGGGGKMATVKGTYTNVREDNYVDAGWWDNLVVKVDGTGTVIGTVEKSGPGKTDGYTWYYLALTPEVKDASSMWGWAGEHTHGWVREDVVNIV